MLQVRKFVAVVVLALSLGVIAAIGALAGTVGAGLHATANVNVDPPPGGGEAQIVGCGSFTLGGGGGSTVIRGGKGQKRAPVDDATIALEPPPGVVVTSGENPASLGTLPDSGAESCRIWTVDIPDDPACVNRPLNFTVRVAAPGQTEATDLAVLQVPNPCGTGSIRGNVAGAVGGGITGAEVWACRPDGTDCRKTTTAPGGDYDFSMPPAFSVPTARWVVTAISLDGEQRREPNVLVTNGNNTFQNFIFNDVDPVPAGVSFNSGRSTDSRLGCR